MGRNFMQLLEAQWALGKRVCVGLDSDPQKLPTGLDQVTFTCKVIDATCDIAGVYKPNLAFYLALGHEGLSNLREVFRYSQEVAPEIPVILDAKYGDIGSTNEGYVQLALDYLKADAVTVHNYMGRVAMRPFLSREDKGIIVLCHTSNEGADEFQDQIVLDTDAPEGSWPVYQKVAHRVATAWNTLGNCALVVGATYPLQLREVREIVGDVPILVPGVGFQQKDVPLREQVQQVVDAGGERIIINSARGILYPKLYEGEDRWAASHREVRTLQDLTEEAITTRRAGEER